MANLYSICGSLFILWNNLNLVLCPTLVLSYAYRPTTGLLARLVLPVGLLLPNLWRKPNSDQVSCMRPFAVTIKRYVPPPPLPHCKHPLSECFCAYLFHLFLSGLPKEILNKWLKEFSQDNNRVLAQKACTKFETVAFLADREQIVTHFFNTKVCDLLIASFWK